MIFKPKILPKLIKLNLIRYESNGFRKMFNFLCEKRFANKVIILIDSRKYLAILELLILEYLVDGDTDRVITLNSNEKQSKTFQEIANSDNIPEYVKYILTTRVISDGVNIKNKDIDAVVFLDCRDFALKRQFISRCRNGINVGVYDFLSFIQKDEDDEPFQFDEISSLGRLYKDKLEYVQSNVNLVNESIKGSALVSKDMSDNIKEKLKVGLIYSETKQEFIVAKEKIGSSIVKSLDWNLRRDYNLACNYYSMIACYEVENIDASEMWTINAYPIDLKIIERLNLLAEHGFDIQVKKDVIDNAIKVIRLFYRNRIISC